MSTKVGLVGKGYFGKRLLIALKDQHDVRFVTGREMQVDFDVDWVVIATPMASHYDLAKMFLMEGVNVFCEKPLTDDYNQSLELIELAGSLDQHLYIDDVFRYRDVFREFKATFTAVDLLDIDWRKRGSFSDKIGHSLIYHDLYLLLDLMGDQVLTNHAVEINQLNHKRFSFEFGDSLIRCTYNRAANEVSKTWRGRNTLVDFSRPDNDALAEMLAEALSGRADYAHNNQLALKAQRLLARVQKDVPTVAVVGAGIFGITAALKLNAAGLAVTICERKDEMLMCASSINQTRLHRGYHYPRSMETALEAKVGTVSFLEEYPCRSLANHQYYAVAAMGSLTDDDQFREFMGQVGLSYTREDLDIIRGPAVSGTYRVEEELFDAERLAAICKQKLDETDVRVLYRHPFTADEIADYDYVVNATYANLNQLLDDSLQRDYQFELCEKPLVQLPESYQGIGVVICDGLFNCLDPYGDTSYHLMGNVVHAIHSSNTGRYPVIPPGFNELLNRGVVRHPPITNFSKFIESAQKFFVDIEKAVHIGSLYTIRAVLPNRNHDDARPSLIAKHSNSLYSLFSGKISTCVDVANDLVRYILIS